MWINYNRKEQHSIRVDRRWEREGGEESGLGSDKGPHGQKATMGGGGGSPAAYPGQVVEGNLHGTLSSSTTKGRQTNKMVHKNVVYVHKKRRRRDWKVAREGGAGRVYIMHTRCAGECVATRPLDSSEAIPRIHKPPNPMS
jgi:hypothetical protein